MHMHTCICTHTPAQIHTRTHTHPHTTLLCLLEFRSPVTATTVQVVCSTPFTARAEHNTQFLMPAWQVTIEQFF